MKLLLSFLTLAGAAWADFSPLDIQPEGIGTVTIPMGARERAMGNSGMASTTQPGIFIANPSRLAFQEKHSFSGTMETSMEYLHDDYTGNRRSDAFLPGLTLAFPAHKYGALGFWYWQTSHRNFTYENENKSTGLSQAFRAEGGLFELGASYSYAFVPQFSLGIDFRKMLGQDRFIRSAAFDGSNDNFAQVNSTPLTGDTTVRSLDGMRGGVSATFRQRKWSIALAMQTGATLDIDTKRHITNITTDQSSKSELELPYMGMLGLALKPTPRQTVTLDVNLADWDPSQNANLNRQWSLGAGYEFQGSNNLYDSYWKKCSLRAGGGFENLYLDESWQGFATVGLSLPLGSRGHLVDIAIAGGHREAGGNNFLAEEYLKLSVTVQGVGVWGQPLRRRR